MKANIQMEKYLRIKKNIMIIAYIMLNMINKNILIEEKYNYKINSIF